MIHAVKTEIIEISGSESASEVDAVVQLYLIFDDSPDAKPIRRTEHVRTANLPGRPRRMKQRIRNLAMRQSTAYFNGDAMDDDVSLFDDLPVADRRANLATLDDVDLLGGDDFAA